ncbi:MAG TPA: DUF3159 domain-containing protein [Halanaerobiales bacterium]|nr:DUF3159 domain-containing protein [Halanaerobiales bacterium]
MSIRIKELLEELRTVLSSKTIDAILPPLIFVLTSNFLNLTIASVSAILVSLVIGIIRLLKKQPWKYAFGGLIIVIIASSLAYFTKNTASYFIPSIINSTVLIIIATLSLIINKPLAAWASHLTRGWPLEWFWRDDIKPAYREVTIFWVIFLLMRLTIQIYIYRLGESNLTWSNILLGWPFTITILLISYIYGIWRLKKLGGPGVEEFKENKKPPWEGQKRGF